jgi:hypothetical protein
MAREAGSSHGGLTMDDLDQARERGGRLDELPEHERDDDVAGQLGGGVIAAGGTAEVRGTGERTGNAQSLDDEEEDRGGSMADPVDSTPGIRDFTDASWEAGDDERGAQSGGSRKTR